MDARHSPHSGGYAAGQPFYTLNLAIKRETHVRCGLTEPRNPHEHEQARQGPMPIDHFDCVQFQRAQNAKEAACR